MRIRRRLLDSPPRRSPGSRTWAAGLLAAAGLCAQAAAEFQGAGIHYPENSDWNLTYRQVEDFLVEKDWNRAIEALAILAQGIEAGAEGDPASQPPGVVPAGGGFALGQGAAFNRLVKRLPEEELRRLRVTIESQLQKRWEAAGDPVARGALRRQVIRDFPWSELALEAAREEVDAGIELGYLDRVLAAGIFIRDHPGSSFADRLLANRVLVEVAEQTGRRDLWSESRSRIEDALRSVPGKAAALDAEAASRIRTRLEHPFSPPAGAGDRFRSPLQIPSPSESPIAHSGFELGSVQARRPFELSELRNFLTERVPPRPLQISPATAAGPAPDPGAAAKPPAPAGAAARGQPADLALPFFPAARGDQLFVQTYQELLAYALPTLEVQWSCPLDPSPFEALGSLKAPAVGLDQVIAAYGDRMAAFSAADGKSLWKKAFAYDRSVMRLAFGPPPLQREPPREAPPPELPRVEGRQPPEGERVRILPPQAGAQGNEAGSPLIPVALTPPAVHLDDYLVGATVRVDREILIFLASVSRGGDLRWSTYLGSVRGLDPLGMGATASPPLVVGDRVYLLANLGFVAAVEASEGRILWLRSYSRLDDAGKAQSILSGDRWQPNPILHYRPGAGASDWILLAPQDADLLLGLEAQTGDLAFELPRERHTTLLGAHADRCILGGLDVSAVSLTPADLGTVLWRWTPPGASLISLGRAVLDGGWALVSDLNALYTIDLRSGRENSAALWDFRGSGGNLLPLPSGHLAVVSAGGLLIYNHRERERERVATLPPDSEIRILESAKLELKGGEVEAGLRTLGRWVDGHFPDPPPNSPTDRLLFEIAEAMRYTVDLQGEEGPQASELLRMLFLTERFPEAKAVAAFRAAQVHLQRGNHREAVAMVQEALSQNLGEVACPVNDFLAVPGRVLAESILQGVRRSGAAGESAFLEFEWAAQDVLATARRQGTQPAFLRVINGFPLTRAGGVAQIELANYFQNQKNLTESVRWLLNYLRSFPAAENYVPIALQAVNLFTSMGRYSEARDLLLALARDYPDRPLRDAPPAGPGDLRETVKMFVERRLLEPGFREIDLPPDVTWLQFPVRMSWRSPADLLTTDRDFLEIEGELPPRLRGHFFTHSRDLIDCRSVETGLPLWTIEFALIPTMKVQRFSFVNRRRSAAQVSRDLLVYHDSTNVLGIDIGRGIVRWHLPFESPDHQEIQEGIRAAIPSLQERIRGVAVGEDGIYITTTGNKLYRHERDGIKDWEKALPFDPSRFAHGPYLTAGGLALVRKGPVEVAFLDPRTGEEQSNLPILEGSDARTIQPPLLIGNHLLLLLPSEMTTVDLAGRRIAGRFRDRESIFRDLWKFPAYPDQVILSLIHRQRAVLAGVSMTDGRELWRYEGFSGPRPGNLSVFADDTRLYVIQGDEKRALTAIDIKPGPDADNRFTSIPMWPESITLGTFFINNDNRDLLVTQDSVIFPDPASNSISVYDKFEGVHRHAMIDPINRFLVDKRRFQCNVQDGTLIFLTDRGDCGFDSRNRRIDLQVEREKVDRLVRYLKTPADWDNVIWLALSFFRENNPEAAIEILNRSLLSEQLPSLDSPGKYQMLKFLLDGIKEELMKEKQPTIVCRRFRVPPAVDGELNEGWNFTQRVVLRTPLNLNAIQVSSQEADIWKGEEDLSAVLYTGWDDRYFYFALDVDDNRIWPYDKEAKFWKGDCLVIGLDPTGDGGIHHHGDDQLLTLALTIPNRNKKKNPPGQDSDEEDEGRKPDGKFAVKKKDDNSGVIYEVAIPWSTFGEEFQGGAPPAAGKRFGLSLLVTDDDTGQGATKMLSLNPCHLLPHDQSPLAIWKHLIPEYFPKVILE